ncbi:MAG: pentapeptide repeat-containing protein [Desulfomicrobium sp.]|nr:pentapeptide repeat-containing protein [Desulfomicrobium sp.]
MTDARLAYGDLTGADLTETVLTNADLLMVKIDQRWRDHVLSQGVRNADTIQWIEPAPGVPVNPKDLKSPGAMKFDKKPKVPVGIPKPQ